MKSLVTIANSEADDRDKAIEFIAKYDSAMQCQDTAALVHRVSHYLAGKGPACIGTDFRTYANGGPMSSRLRTEVTAYQLCMLDDSMQEGPHARISRIVSRSRASKPHGWSAKLRLSQNLAIEKDINAIAGSGQFDLYFRGWKALTQRHPLSYRQVVMQRISTKKFLSKVYRCGSHSCTDWSALSLLSTRSSTASGGRPQSSAIREVKIDYLRRVCKRDMIFSLPKLADVGADTRAEQDMARLTGFAPDSGVPELVCFKVVHEGIVRQRHVDTAAMALKKKYAVPVSVQFYTPWNLTEYPCSFMEVYPDGLPQIVDLLELADWRNVATCLRSWTMAGPADVAGCWSLTSPQVVADTQWTLGWESVYFI